MKEMFIICLTVAFASGILRGSPKLKFREDGTFKIVQLTDTHYEKFNVDVNKTLSVIETVLELEKPDLVVLTGDLVSGYMWDGTQDWFKDRWQSHIDLLTKHQQYWAYVLGNHDGEADLARRLIIDLDSQQQYSLTQLGSNQIGNSTYSLPLYNNSGSSHIRTLWLLDSRREDCMGVPGWGCISPDGVNWYKNNADGKEGYAFMHIPLPEYMTLWNNYEVVGMRDEEICCSSVNTGMFAAIKEKGDIRAVFSGHDHNNDFMGNLYGVDLVYGRKTGYGSYGPPEGVMRGARVIVLKEEGGYSTYIRQEDGSIEKQEKPFKGIPVQLKCCGVASSHYMGHDLRKSHQIQ